VSTDFTPGVTAPVVGTTSLQNLHDLLGKNFPVLAEVISHFTQGAVDVHLSDEDIKELEEAYQPQAAFGHS
jgi:aryl-alcohol dehydrogenase-like predicted oxidoreductase